MGAFNECGFIRVDKSTNFTMINIRLITNSVLDTGVSSISAKSECGVNQKVESV